MAKKNNHKQTSGWALTKWFPFMKHPAHYKKQGDNDVEYITFTHSNEVEHKNKKVTTIPLTENVSKKEREENKQKNLAKGENISYAYPKVYRGKRSALGSETDEFSLVDEDKKIVNEMFKTLPREDVPYTSNSKKKKPDSKKDK